MVVNRRRKRKRSSFFSTQKFGVKLAPSRKQRGNACTPNPHECVGRKGGRVPKINVSARRRLLFFLICIQTLNYRSERDPRGVEAKRQGRMQNKDKRERKREITNWVGYLSLSLTGSKAACREGRLSWRMRVLLVRGQSKLPSTMLRRSRRCSTYKFIMLLQPLFCFFWQQRSDADFCMT